MKHKSVKQTVEDILSISDVKIDGQRPWDIKVYHPDFYSRLLAGSSMAFGESYMDQWWDCEALDQLIDRIWRARLDKKIRRSKEVIWNTIKARLFNLQSRNRAFQVGEKHYDLGNDLYELMLDKRMNYSCAYWKNANTLDEAQEAKLNLICRKMQLAPGMKVLDIGCGWGSFAKYAAEQYGAKVTGITISKKQLALAKENCAGLDVDIRLQDYRDLNEKFERAVSIGMFEHVGYKNYREYFKTVDRCLEDDGLFLLHTIGSNKKSTHLDPWINKYIFPNAVLPSAHQITKASVDLMKIEDWHNFPSYYEKTLHAWNQNFNNNWEKIKDQYGVSFKRMWNFYLLSSAGTFKAGQNQLWQIVFSKIDAPIDYQSIR
ncbi:MAG: cyclopropane fatty acyl phospholipid synthase [Reichenbachiella sp.]|uniref:cyclopropane fatty acyl phospholipid synthase n=1 Tax=Reichenbachiella sp. TaxID=2184521 RepID=UPI003266CDD4